MMSFITDATGQKLDFLLLIIKNTFTVFHFGKKKIGFRYMYYLPYKLQMDMTCNVFTKTTILHKARSRTTHNLYTNNCSINIADRFTSFGFKGEIY